MGDIKLIKVRLASYSPLGGAVRNNNHKAEEKQAPVETGRLR